MRLSKAGYGTPEEVLNTGTEIVLHEIEYERFIQDYQEEFINLNKEQ